MPGENFMPMKKHHLKYYLAGAVSLITVAVYLYALQNGFVEWDDPEYVFENTHIRSFDSAFFRWAFLSFYASNWHPLTWMSHALDYLIWGLNPWGHHLTSIILHAVNTFLVVVLVARLVEASKPLAIHDSPFTLHSSPFTFHSSHFTLIAAATTGLLFGIHPVHVESVAWVAERKDLLCALFFLLSIMMYLNAVKRMEPGAERKSLTLGAMRYALCFFVLALLSKPMAVSLPVVLLILDWFPLGRMQSVRSLRSALFEKLPFIGLSLISSVLTVLAQRAGGAMEALEHVTFGTRMLVAAGALISYLRNMLLPINLMPFYPYPRDASLLSPEYLSTIVIAIVITIACAVTARRQRLFSAVWGYYVVTLIPVLGIVQVGLQSMADRYTYLPSLGPFMLIGVTAAWGAANTSGKRSLWAAVAVAGIVILTSASLITVTSRQIAIWRTSFDLWDYVIEKEPGRVPVAHYNRGCAYSKIGRLDKAIEDYNKAIELNPLYFEAYNNRGSTYGQTGSFAAAIEQFNKAIEIKPDFSSAYRNRGLTYFLIGEYAMALGDLNKAIILDSDFAKAYLDRGNVYVKTGRKELAVPDFQKACDLGEQAGCEVLMRYGR